MGSFSGRRPLSGNIILGKSFSLGGLLTQNQSQDNTSLRGRLPRWNKLMVLKVLCDVKLNRDGRPQLREKPGWAVQTWWRIGSMAGCGAGKKCIGRGPWEGTLIVCTDRLGLQGSFSSSTLCLGRREVEIAGRERGTPSVHQKGSGLVSIMTGTLYYPD